MRLLTQIVSRCYPAFPRRNVHLSSPVQGDEMKRLMFRLNGFNKLGLLADDILTEFDPDIQEAIRRLPEEQQMQRIYRAIRAQQAELNNVLLPPDQWTKFEDDHNYLQPYLKEVKKERAEREEWEATH